MSSTQPRDLWGDAAKGLGILLVLYGHISFVPDRMADFIYAFHMPLFMVLSGYFWKFRAEQKWIAVVAKEAKSLVLPFILFWLATWIFWLAKSFALHREILWWRPVVGLVYGVDGLPHWLESNAVLWFFPFLFSLRVSYDAWMRIQGKSRWWIFGLAVVAAGFWLSQIRWRLPWSMDYALYAWPWFLFGQFLKSKSFGERRTWEFSFIGLALLVVLGVLSAFDFVPRMVWNGGTLLPAWFYLPTALCGIMGVLFLRFPQKVTEILAYIGRRTLWIFAMHLAFYSVISAVWTVVMHRAPAAEDAQFYVFQFAMPLFALLGILVIHPKVRQP